MEVVDIVLLIILGFGTYKGFSTGLLMQLLGIIAFFVAIIGGFHLMQWGADFLGQYMNGYREILPFLSFVIIFILIMVLINMVGKGLKSVLDMTLLGSFDNLAGAMVGLLKWAFVLSIVIWIVGSFGLVAIEDYSERTTIFPLVATLAPLVLDSIGLLIPQLQEIISPEENLPQAWLVVVS